MRELEIKSRLGELQTYSEIASDSEREQKQRNE